MAFVRKKIRMRPTEQIIKAISAYSSHKKLSERYVSDQIFSSNNAVIRIRKNGGITLRSYEKAMEWLAANWPEDLPWPKGVQKIPPKPTQRSAS